MVRTKDGIEGEIDMSEKKKGEENAKTKEWEEKEDYIMRERQTEEEQEGKKTQYRGMRRIGEVTGKKDEQERKK